jgi:hypothetical protein
VNANNNATLRAELLSLKSAEARIAMLAQFQPAFPCPRWVSRHAWRRCLSGGKKRRSRRWPYAILKGCNE